MLLDTGALGNSYISADLADKLAALPRRPFHVWGTFADGTAWEATQRVRVPLRLLSTELGLRNRDITIECIIIPKLQFDVIIGALDIVGFNLYSLLKAVLIRFQRKNSRETKFPSGVVAGIPFINHMEDDGFADLEAFPNPLDEERKDEFAYAGPEELREWVTSLMRDYADIFITKVRAECADVPPLQIELVAGATLDDSKFQQKVRPQCPQFEDNIQEQIAELSNLQVITSALCANYCQVLLVRKQDGTLRFCIDYRPLNDITKPRHYPLPHATNIFQRVKNAKYFTVLDLTAGYHQCPMHKESQSLTAFITSRGKYQFTRVPFGLKQAPAYFQQVMCEVVLKDFINKICICYIDDIIIFGSTVEEIKEHTEMVLKQLRKHRIGIKKSKCKFGLRSVQYVGHIFDENGVSLSNERKRSVIEMTKPKTVQELRAFLGTANYFRSFIQNYAHITEPLSALIPPKCKKSQSKTSMVTWNAAADDAFIAIRNAIANAPQLAFLQTEGKVKLYTDASEYAIGAHLVQVDSAGVEKTVAFFSQVLSAQRRRWNVSEKEMFAVIAAVDKLHTYIGGRPFTVVTDHRNLTFWRTTSASSKVERWRQLLSTYDITWELLPGEENVVADSLSRLIMHDEDVTQSSSVVSMIAATSAGKPKKRQRKPQRPTDPRPEPIASSDDESIDSDADEPPINLAEIHGDVAGHFKVDKTLQLLRHKGIVWKDMYKHVSQFIRSCPVCQKTSNAPTHSHGPTFTLGAKRPNHWVATDLMGELEEDSRGYKYIIVFVDHFSGFCRLFPMKSKEASECAERLLEYICRDGKPENLRSDNGREFVNSMVAEMLKMVTIKHFLTTPESHQENAKVERAIKDVRQQLKAYLVEVDKANVAWSTALPLIERLMNTKYNTHLQCTPAEVHFGVANALDFTFAEQPPMTSISPNEYVEKIKNFQNLIIQKAALLAPPEETTDFTVFHRGDIVMVKNSTVVKSQIDAPLFNGPYLVIGQQDGQVTYENYHTKRAQNVHVSRCRPYFSREGDAPAEVKRQQALHKFFTVDRILSHSYKGKDAKKVPVPARNVFFKVRWLGYSADDDTEEQGTNNSILSSVAFVKYAENHPELQHLVRASLPDP